MLFLAAFVAPLTVGTPLVQILITLVVVGVLLWLVNLIPMQSTIKSILNTIVVIIVVLWLLQVFGLFTSLSTIRVGR
jgi:formate hydrogenlyase subunit 4